MTREHTAPGDLHAAVRGFLEDRVESVEQLEILLLLQRHPDRSWTAADAASELGLLESRVARHLEALGRRDLLDVRLGHNVRYRFSPATETLAAAARQVAEAYRERCSAVIAFVTTRRLRALRDFSDAFKLTEDPEDG